MFCSTIFFYLFPYQPLQITFDAPTEDKPETPGEAPDPQIGGLGGARPLGIAQLPPETPPPPIAKKKAPITPPPLPPRLDLDEVCYSTQFLVVVDPLALHAKF